MASLSGDRPQAPESSVFSVAGRAALLTRLAYRLFPSVRTVLALALLALVTAAPAAAGLAVDVAGSQERGYGRIVITFKDRQLLPQYVARSTSGVLVLQFADAVDAKVDRLANDLPGYISVARRDPDGMALRIALQRQIRVNTMEAGERLFIDLLPPNWTGAPPALPDSVVKELAARAEAALKAAREADAARFGVKLLPKLDFKVARQPTFTRFSFGWNVPYDTQMTRDGDKVRIAFNRIAKVDLSPVLVDAPPGLREISAEDGGDRLAIVLTVAPEADVRGFRDDQTYVVDLTLPGAVDTSPKVVLAPEAPKAGTSERVGLPGTDTKVAATPAPPAPVKTAEKPLPDEKVAAAPDANSEPQEAETSAAVSGELPPETPALAAGPQTVVRAEARRIGNVFRIAFPFRDKVASAAFKRQDTLFVLFDTPLPIDLNAVKSVLGPAIRDIAVDKLSDGRLLRITLAEPQLTTLGNDGSSWVLSIGELVLEPARPLKVDRYFKPGGRGVVRVDLTEPGLVHQITDPVIGDTLIVVTAAAPARGILKARSFAELDTLPSAHGVAVVARVDDLKATLDPTGVTLTREDGLSLSNGAQPDGPLTVPKSAPKPPRVQIDGLGYFTRDSGELGARQRELQTAVAMSTDQRRTAARIQLAQFYLANRFAPEAMGSLRRASDDDPALARDPGFIVLYAAAQALNGRNEAARQALARGEVTESADAALWRTIVTARLGRWDEARAATERAQGAVGGYSPDVQGLFQLAAAEAAIESGDAVRAQSYLAQIEPTAVDADIRAQYEILQGRVADAAGRPDDALARYDRADAAANRESSAEAEYRRLRQLVRDGKIDRDAAIDRLKTLAFSWRGDDVELQTLRFLANLQAEAGHWREAFSAMRSAVLVGPEKDSTRKLQDEMGREFASLYLDGKADALDPLDALTLYYDFRDLTPPGRMGDEIVRKLADRLVGVDLLDQAAELLSYQVDNRLKGAARAQIAADLALVYLIDRKPDRALAVLNKTRQSGLAASVERQRRMVEARALGDSGRTELALELAAPLTGGDAGRLRADVLWKAKRWKDAGEELETMLGGRWSDAAPLDDQERQDALRGAVAFALANDQTALDRLRAKYMPKMAASPSARIFDVVTQPIQSMGDDFREVARKVTAIDSLKGFVDEYRNHYLTPSKAPAVAAAPDAAKPAAPKAAPSKPAEVAMNAQAGGHGSDPAKPAAKEPAKEPAKPAGH
jgi:hypothetical protein